MEIHSTKQAQSCGINVNHKDAINFVCLQTKANFRQSYGLLLTFISFFFLQIAF